MNDNPMTEQVAKLVGNLLAGGETISLPGVGSLRIERQPARRIDRRHVVPPCRRVEFSSQEAGVSLVEEIGRVLRVNGVRPEDPRPEARKVYDRWLAQVRDEQEQTLTITGVGVLRYKTFTADEAFDRRLNPQGHEPVRVRAPRRFDAVLWIGIVAIVGVLGFTAWWWFGESDLRQERQPLVADRAAGVQPGAETGAAGMPAAAGVDSAALTTGTVTGAVTEDMTGSMTASSEPEVQPAVSATTASGTPASQPSAGAAASQQPAASQTTPAPAGNPSADRTAVANGSDARTQSASLVSGRSYVVMGVFSSEKNARRAAAEASAKEASVTCGIYRFGSKFMVSPFESDDAEACRLYIRAHGERFPGMWTYTAR